jgi:nucleoside-diphosphate-sugar epimerase
VREIVTKITELGGRPELVHWGAYPLKEDAPMLIQCDNGKLRSTGWTPKYDLASGLRQTFEWWRREFRG